MSSNNYNHDHNDSDIKKILAEFHREQQLLAEKKQTKELEEIAEKNEQAEFYAGKMEIISGYAGSQLQSLLERIGNSLGWLFMVATIILIPINIYRMFHAALVREEKDKVGLASRSMQFFLGMTSVVLGLLAIIVTAGVLFIATPILLVAGAVKSCLENIWNVGQSIYERFTIGPKLDAQIKSLQTSNHPGASQQLDNLIRERRALNFKIAEKSHLLLISAVALVGAALLFTPAAPVGMIMIVAVAAYSVVSAVAFNWIANKFIGKKTTMKSSHDAETKQMKPDNRITETDNDKLAAQRKEQLQQQQTNAVKNHNTETDIFAKISSMFGFTPKKLAKENIKINHEPALQSTNVVSAAVKKPITNTDAKERKFSNDTQVDDTDNNDVNNRNEF